jgi:hypothetical protein
MTLRECLKPINRWLGFVNPSQNTEALQEFARFDNLAKPNNDFSDTFLGI